MQQLGLSLDPQLAVQHRNLRECFASCVYRIGLARVAGALDVASSNLSSMLSGDRNLDADLIERFMAEFHDTTPAQYLAARWLQSAEAVRNNALAQLPSILAQLQTAMQVAGVAPVVGRGARR